MTEKAGAIAVDLAVEIVRDHFGSVPAGIVNLLARRGPQNLVEIVGGLEEIPFVLTRNALLSLIHHNVVDVHSNIPPTAATSAAGKPRPGSLKYTVSLDKILIRSRYARFVQYVQHARGALGRTVFAYVCRMGRASLSTAVKSISEELASKGDAFAALDEEEEEESFEAGAEARSRRRKDATAIKNEFVALVRDNFLKKVDLPFGSPSASTEGSTHVNIDQTVGTKPETSTPGRRGRPSSKAAAKAAATSSRKRRPNVDFALASLDPTSTDGSNGGDVTRPQKRAATQSHTSSSQLEVLSEELLKTNQVFCINCNHLNACLLRKLAEDTLAIQWADSTIVRLLTRALLLSARLQTNGLITRGLSFDDLTAALRQFSSEKENSGFQVPERNTLLRLLDALSRTDKVIRNVSREGQSVFIFDWDKFREVIQDRTIFQAIAARCGIRAGRVWGLLVRSNVNASSSVEQDSGVLWEDHQVAEKSLLSPHAAREILYNLCCNGFARMHISDVVTGASSSAAAKHGLVFSSTNALAATQVLHATYKIILKLLLRKRVEAATVSALYCRSADVSNEADEAETLRLREAGEDVIEFAYLRMDNAVLVLRDV